MAPFPVASNSVEMTKAAFFLSGQPCSRGQVGLQDLEPLPFPSLGNTGASVGLLSTGWGQRPIHLKSPCAFPAAPCLVSAEDTFSQLSGAVHGSELRSSWPPGLLGYCRPGQATAPNHCMASLSLGSGTDSSCAVNPSNLHIQTHLFFQPCIKILPLQSLPIPRATRPAAFTAL